MKRYLLILSATILVLVFIVCMCDKRLEKATEIEDVCYHTPIETDSIIEVAKQIKLRYSHDLDSLNESLYQQQIAPHYLTEAKIIYKDSIVKVVKQKTIYKVDTVTTIIYDTLRQTIVIEDTIRQFYDKRYDKRKNKKKRDK